MGENKPVTLPHVLQGLGIALGANVAGPTIVILACGGGIDSILSFSAALAWILQWIWLGPAIFVAHRKGRRGIQLGLILGSALTLLLSVATCFRG